MEISFVNMFVKVLVTGVETDINSFIGLAGNFGFCSADAAK